MNQKVEERFRAFGRFLQTYEFEAPLTWQAIEDALPALGPTYRNVSKRIRASLLDLGYVLASKGELERRDAYVSRRNALMPITRAPRHIRSLLERYAA